MSLSIGTTQEKMRRSGYSSHSSAIDRLEVKVNISLLNRR